MAYINIARRGVARAEPQGPAPPGVQSVPIAPLLAGTGGGLVEAADAINKRRLKEEDQAADVEVAGYRGGLIAEGNDLLASLKDSPGVLDEDEVWGELLARSDEHIKQASNPQSDQRMKAHAAEALPQYEQKIRRAVRDENDARAAAALGITIADIGEKATIDTLKESMDAIRSSIMESKSIPEFTTTKDGKSLSRAQLADEVVRQAMTDFVGREFARDPEGAAASVAQGRFTDIAGVDFTNEQLAYTRQLYERGEQRQREAASRRVLSQSTPASIAEDWEKLQANVMGSDGMPAERKEATLELARGLAAERLSSLLTQHPEQANDVLALAETPGQTLLEPDAANVLARNARNKMRERFENLIVGDPRRPPGSPVEVKQRQDFLNENAEALKTVYTPEEIEQKFTVPLQEQGVQTLVRETMRENGRMVVAGQAESYGVFDEEQSLAVNVAVEEDVIPWLSRPDVPAAAKVQEIVRVIRNSKQVPDALKTFINSREASSNVDDILMWARITREAGRLHDAALQTSSVRQRAGQEVTDDPLDAQVMSSRVHDAMTEKQRDIANMINTMVEHGVGEAEAAQGAFAVYEKRGGQAEANAKAWDELKLKDNAPQEAQDLFQHWYQIDRFKGDVHPALVAEMAQAAKFHFVKNGGDEDAAWASAADGIDDVWGVDQDGRLRRDLPELVYRPSAASVVAIRDALQLTVRDALYEAERTLPKDGGLTPEEKEALPPIDENLFYVPHLRPIPKDEKGEPLDTRRLRTTYDRTGWEPAYTVWSRKGAKEYPVMVGGQPLTVNLTQDDFRKERMDRLATADEAEFAKMREIAPRGSLFGAFKTAEEMDKLETRRRELFLERVNKATLSELDGLAEEASERGGSVSRLWDRNQVKRRRKELRQAGDEGLGD